MADLESTTHEPVDAQQTATTGAPSGKKFDSRLLTIGDCPVWEPTNYDPGKVQPNRRPPSPMPFLRLKGRWLDHAGFAIGSKVRVEVSAGRLVIEALPQFPERAPHLPRRAEKLFF